METQFEIHSHLEKKHYVEYYRYIWRKRMILVVLCALVGALSLLANITNDDGGGLLRGILLMIYTVWLYFRPWMAAGKLVKRESQNDGTETVESVTKFGEEILDETKHLAARVSYDEIKAIHISESVIVLQDVRKVDLILDKNGFIKGTLEELLPFIQEKCPQLKLTKW